MKMETYVSFYAGFVADFVEVVCCYSWSDFAANNIQNFTGEPADFAHGILAGFIEDRDLVFAEKLVLRIAIL